MNTSSSITFLFGLVIVIGACAVAFMLWLVSSLIAELFDSLRDKKALAKRDREMRRWGMKPFDQDRQQS